MNINLAGSYDAEKTGKQDVTNFIEVGWVEAEKVASQYRSVMLFAFCQDLCSNLIKEVILRGLAMAWRRLITALRRL